MKCLLSDSHDKLCYLTTIIIPITYFKSYAVLFEVCATLMNPLMNPYLEWSFQDIFNGEAELEAVGIIAEHSAGASGPEAVDFKVKMGSHETHITSG